MKILIERMKKAPDHSIAFNTFKRLNTRRGTDNIYKCIFFKKISAVMFSEFAREEDFVKKIESFFMQDKIDLEKIRITYRRMDYGKKNLNPMEIIPFFDNHADKGFYFIDKENLSELGYLQNFIHYFIGIYSIDRILYLLPIVKTPVRGLIFREKKNKLCSIWKLRK